MCGRISLAGTRQRLEERFKVKAPEYKPNYNASPTQLLPVILDESPGAATMCRWGLLPHWAKDEKIGYSMINARAETISEKPTFSRLITSNRCLVIADGFYEWKKDGKIKIPYRIILNNGDFFAMAGLWTSWVHDGKEVKSFTIITTTANSRMSRVHDRMPAILQQTDEKKWLDPGFKNRETLLVPFDHELRIYPVSSLVNSPKNNSVEVIKPIL